MIILPFMISAVLAITLAVLYNKYAVKDYPHENKIFINILSVILFLISALAFCGIILTNNYADSRITAKSSELEAYITENFSDNQFVRNGYDLSNLNQDGSQSAVIVSELTAMIPSHTELGINKLIYDFAVDYAGKQLRKRLVVVDYTIGAANLFADENNTLTVSSVIHGLTFGILKVIHIILFIIAAIVFLILLIFILVTLSHSSKERKRLEAEAQPETAA